MARAATIKLRTTTSLLLVAATFASLAALLPPAAARECLYDHHCPAICEGTVVRKRGCTSDGRCELTNFTTDCSRRSSTLTVSGQSFTLPDLCIPACDGAHCERDNAKLLLDLSAEMDRLRREFADTEALRISLEDIMEKSSRLCIDLIEDAVSRLLGEIADMILGASKAKTLAKLATDATVTIFNGLNSGGVKPDNAIFCTLQERLRDHDLPKVIHARNVLIPPIKEFETEGKKVRIARERDIAANENCPTPDIPPDAPTWTPTPTSAPSHTATPTPAPPAPMVEVPHLYGWDIENARRDLARAGLEAGAISRAPSDHRAAGEVMDQSPAGGTMVPLSTRVDLTLSSGSPAPEGLEVVPATATIDAGEEVEFAAKLVFPGGGEHWVTYGATWQPGPDHKFVGDREGTYTITATYGGHSGSASVTVGARAFPSPPVVPTWVRGQQPGPDDLDWVVLCNVRTGEVTYARKTTAPFAPDRREMAGPFVGPRSAQGWIETNCPQWRCTPQVACATGAVAAPPGQDGWYVVCNPQSRSVAVTKHPAAQHRRWAGPLIGEPDARRWLRENCPTNRCDENGACVTSTAGGSGAGGGRSRGGGTSGGGGGGGDWYVLCNPGHKTVVLAKRPYASHLRVVGGPFAGEPDARAWANGRCPSWRCDADGRCVSGSASSDDLGDFLDGIVAGAADGLADQQRQRDGRTATNRDRLGRTGDAISGLSDGYDPDIPGIDDFIDAVQSNRPQGGGGPGGLQDVYCRESNIVLKVWDHSSQDGDIITLRLGGQNVLDNFDLNQCGGSEPASGPCVHRRTLSGLGRIPVSVYAHNEGSSSPNTAAIKIEGGCTPEQQSYQLKTGETASISILRGGPR